MPLFFLTGIIYFSVISCKDPGSPLHGRQWKVTRNFTVGGIVRFKCSENYTMEGTGKLTCLKNKAWNREIPKCLGKPFVISTVSTMQFILIPPISGWTALC